MNISPQFFARMCWITDHSLKSVDYHKRVIQGVTTVSGIIDSTLIDVENVECVLYTFHTKDSKKVTMTVFKSTDSEADWNDNFDIRLTEYPVPEVDKCCSCSFFAGKPLIHRGYIRQYSQIKDQLHTYYDKHTDADVNIITGFSLGGGMATVLSYIANLPNTYTVVFGSPRVGNRAFVTDFQTRTNIRMYQRWVFNNDPIPNLPPGIVYKHIPGIKHIKADSDTVHEVETCSLCELLKNDRKDHDLMKYYDKIDTTPIV